MPIRLYRGETGKLEVSLNKNEMTGRYDWKGFEYSGVIRGTYHAEHIEFEWEWGISKEKGKGMFYTNFHNILCGGWWLENQNFELKDYLPANKIPGNLWIFYRDPNQYLYYPVNNMLANRFLAEVESLRMLVANNKLKEFFMVVKNFCKVFSVTTEDMNEILLIENRYTRALKEKRLGLVSDNSEFNRVTYSLLEVIDNLATNYRRGNFDSIGGIIS